jgi:uncharacterized membrane protein YeaQ/YmgE (transglycosylase-associated protein family)
MLHLIWSVIVGFVAGLIARAVTPGADQMGFIIGRLIHKPEPDAKFHPAGFLMSIVGAIVLLLILRLLR